MRSILVPCVLLLFHSKQFCDLSLIFVVILTNIPQPLIVIHNASNIVFKNFTIQLISCIDFTTILLYNMFVQKHSNI